MSVETRLKRLEQQFPAIDAENGYFVVGSEEHAEALQMSYVRAGQVEPQCLVTGIARDRALWIPSDEPSGPDSALARLTEEEFDALVAVVRGKIEAREG